MSVVTRTRRLTERYVPSPSAETVPAVPAARHEAEAPERAACPREAPDGHPGHPAEAPDAGLGRSAYLEHEFTHGRSQS